jgi:hypothetical protein
MGVVCADSEDEEDIDEDLCKDAFS